MVLSDLQQYVLLAGSLTVITVGASYLQYLLFPDQLENSDRYHNLAKKDSKNLKRYPIDKETI